MAKIIVKNTAVNKRLGIEVIELPLGRQIDVFTPPEPGFVGIGIDEGIMDRDNTGEVIVVGLSETNDPDSQDYDPDFGQYTGCVYSFEQTPDGFKDLTCEATIGHDRSDQATRELYNIAVSLFCMDEGDACFDGSITVVEDDH